MNQKVLRARKILGLALITGLCLVLAGHAYAAGMGRGGGFSRGPGMTGGGMHGGMHGGKHGGGFHKGNGFHGSTCCQNGFFVGGFVGGSFFGVSDAAAYPYPAYAGGPADTLSLTVQPRTQVDLAPPVPPVACYPSGCYRLRGDGVTVAYEWIWVPAPPPAPQTPGVIQYPNGRYEQRGPSQWVWVPNPPSAPPAAPSPAPQSLAPSGAAAPIPSQYGGLYRWVDEQGVAHWTQGLQAVPERYREQARRGADG